MKKILSLILSLWGPAILFLLGLITLPIGVGLIIWIGSFFMMPIVAINAAKKQYDTRMMYLAIAAIIIPIAAIYLNMEYGFLSKEPESLTVDHYYEIVTESRVWAMVKISAIFEPLVFIILLRNRPVLTIIACVIDILIWLVGIYILLTYLFFPHYY